MEKQLKCDLLLPLKQMTLNRLAVLLWSDSGVLTTIFKFRMRLFIKESVKVEWKETVENKIKEKVFKLGLANSLTKQMIATVRAIGIEIRRWKSSLQGRMFGSISPISLSDWSKVCWTTAGTICSRKTAEELVNWDKLNISQRYSISSYYCLEDNFPLSQEGLSEEAKELIPETKPTLTHVIPGELSHLEYLYRTYGRHLTFNQWAFSYSSIDGNKTGAEYFYKKLSHEEREAAVMRTAHNLLSRRFQEPRQFKEKDSDFTFYLLTLMTPEQQMDVIKTYPCNTFLCFLDWPRQDLFLENVDLLWAYLPKRGYGDLLEKMATRFRYYGHYFPELFQEFFIQSPKDFKESTFVQEPGSSVPNAYPFLCLFLEHEDSKSIEVMFRNVDAGDRAKLIFHCSVLALFYKTILRDRWHMVEICLREATLSKEDMKRLKGAFEEFLKSYKSRRCDWVNRKLKIFFDFLDETDTTSYGEKKGLDETNTRAYEEKKGLDETDTSAYEEKKGLDKTDTSAYEEKKGLDKTDTSAYEEKKGKKRKLENFYQEE